MKVLLSLTVIIAVTVLSSLAFSEERKIILVSDVDDTIKVSHVLNKGGALSHAANISGAFTGMSQLYKLIARESNAKVIYLSNAPEGFENFQPIRFLHENFLEYNDFPAGELLLRKDLNDQNHKLNQLRRLLLEENPSAMILIGDNGERDSEIYHQFTQESKLSGVKIVSFIHQLYGTKQKFILDRILQGQVFAAVGKSITAEQFGYVTPVEISLQLNLEGLLSDASRQWMVDKMAPYIAAQPHQGFNVIGQTTFANFEDCSDFKWRWAVTREITPLVEKIKAECK